MVSWDVLLAFQRDPGLGPTPKAEWDRLRAMAGAFIGYTGPGSPTEFNATRTVEADDVDEAMETALAGVRGAMDDAGVAGWSVEVRDIRPTTAEDEAEAEERQQEAGEQESDEFGYDPGEPPGGDS